MFQKFAHFLKIITDRTSNLFQPFKTNLFINLYYQLQTDDLWKSMVGMGAGTTENRQRKEWLKASAAKMNKNNREKRQYAPAPPPTAHQQHQYQAPTPIGCSKCKE